jgi:hypothetical protein
MALLQQRSDGVAVLRNDGATGCEMLVELTTRRGVGGVNCAWRW